MSNRIYILGAGSSCELKFRITNIDIGFQTIKTIDLESSGPLSSGYFHDFHNFYD